MMRNAPGPVAVALAVLAITPAVAHHSVAIFDGGRIEVIRGTITGFRWINPHASLEVDAAGGRWLVEMSAPGALMAEGWQRDTLATGEHVSVFVHPLREPIPGAERHRGLYAGILLPDGRRLGRTGHQDPQGD